MYLPRRTNFATFHAPSASYGMHKRYLDLQREDVAKAFGLLQDGNTDKDEKEVESQVVDFGEGEEGARWCRWSSKTMTGFFDKRIRTGG